jgi:hypothetical protein
MKTQQLLILTAIYAASSFNSEASILYSNLGAGFFPNEFVEAGPLTGASDPMSLDLNLWLSARI